MTSEEIALSWLDGLRLDIEESTDERIDIVDIDLDRIELCSKLIKELQAKKNLIKRVSQWLSTITTTIRQWTWAVTNARILKRLKVHL